MGDCHVKGKNYWDMPSYIDDRLLFEPDNEKEKIL
jgi:hypothetical protein